MQALTGNSITGILTIFPLPVTVWVVWFVVDLLIGIRRPSVAGIATAVRPTSSDVAEQGRQVLGVAGGAKKS